MKPNLAFDFNVDKNNNTITIKREFAADLSLVWDAYTKPSILDQWWAPRPWKARTKRMDFTEGGEWLYAMVGPAGEEHWSIAQYGKIVPLKSFKGTDGFTDSDGNLNKELPVSHWEVTFIDKGQNTLVDYRITFADLAQLEAILQMGFKEGMTMAMEGLDELLPTLK